MNSPLQWPLWILKQFFALISNSALLAGKLEVFSTGKRSNQTKTKRTFSAIILPQICLVIFRTHSLKQVLIHNIWENQPSFIHLKWNMDNYMACVFRRWGVQYMAIFPYLIHNIKMVSKSTWSKKNPYLMFPCLLILQVSWWNIDVPIHEPLL